MSELLRIINIWLDFAEKVEREHKAIPASNVAGGLRDIMTCAKAAEAENDRLREALEAANNELIAIDGGTCVRVDDDVLNRCQAALRSGEDDQSA